jgi:hypothetical protein
MSCEPNRGQQLLLAGTATICLSKHGICPLFWNIENPAWNVENPSKLIRLPRVSPFPNRLSAYMNVRTLSATFPDC